LSSFEPPLREYVFQVRDREGEVSKVASSGLREAEAFIPRNEFHVLGDHSDADDRRPSRTRFLEGMPKKCGAETPAASIRGHAEPFDVCHRG